MLDSLPSTSLDAEGRGYPRPQLRRDSWYSLNGAWEFAFDPDASWRHPSEVAWTEQIRVPFAPEAPASGISHTGFFRACWYRRTIELPDLPRGGALDAAFTALCGVMLIGVALWLLWELWSAVEPKPITDDFLRILNDSFGRDWRNPLKWPWARMFWAFGFTTIGAAATIAGTVILSTMLASPHQAKTPTIKIETSQSFRISQ